MPGKKSPSPLAYLHAGAVQSHWGRQEDFERQLARAEAFLKDCPPLPKARAPEWRERGGQ